MTTLDDTTTSLTTRHSLHAVAEHVLSAALHAETGRIGLRQTAGGFGTPVFERHGRPRQIVVDGTDIEVRDGAQVRRAPITTLRAAGNLIEIDPGAPVDVYTPTTPLDLDAVLGTDDRHAKVLADWFALVDAALAHLRRAVDGDEPPLTQLWPEHFDLATTIGEVNYGGSPGDDEHDQPYLYVGPWTPPAADGYWNEPFGASRSFAAVSTVDDAVAFFVQGQERLRSA
jgi:hypothetical protein